MMQLQDQILQLSPLERLRLISIASSLTNESMPSNVEVPEPWIQEAQASIAKAKSGESPAYSWEQVKATDFS